MKILLIQPPKPKKALGGEDFHIYEPLALEYLAAAVARNHDVRILDMRLDPDLHFLLQEFQPEVAGITSYTVHVNTVNRLFAQIKAFNRDIVTLAGGHHATVMPEDFDGPCVDAIVAGEGVFPFREIVSRLEKKIDLAAMPGTTRTEKGTLLIRRGGQDGDLDALPFPRRDLTLHYRRMYSSEWMKPIASIRTSKGCLFRCKFCALWKLTGGLYLTRKPECIVEELSMIEEKCIFFADDESFLDTDRMGRLADLIRQSGIEKRFFLYGRSDTVAKHPDLIEKWKKIGLERVFMGLEFIRDTDLKLIRKGSNAEKNRKAVEVLKSLDIDIFPTFIIRPEFERKDFADLRQYCLGLDLNFIGFPVLTPLPGTDLYQEVKEKLISSNYDYFDFFHTLLPTSLPLRDFYRELATLYKRSRSLKNQINFMNKYRLLEWPSLFRAYGDFKKRLNALEQDYPL
jgi:radical SAM superfamily enzyme YgiQ (UPF0313 family)